MANGAGLTKKVIARVVRKKLDDWIDTIDHEDVELAKRVRDDVFVAGGAIASLLLGEKPNDFDVYFKSVETAKRVAEHYVSWLAWDERSIEVTERNGHPYIEIDSVGAAGEEGYQEHLDLEGLDSAPQHPDDSNEESPKYRPVFLTGHAITLSDGIQICIRFTGAIEEVVTHFDFAHTQLAYDYATDRVVVAAPQALSCLLARELVYMGSEYPLSAMFRMRKFLRRGFRINAGQMLLIGFGISRLDLTDPETLEEQLIGVDVAYFYQLIAALRESDRELSSSYLAELVNKIF